MVVRVNRFRALRELASGVLARCGGWWVSNAEDLHLALGALDPAPVPVDVQRSGPAHAAFRR